MRLAVVYDFEFECVSVREGIGIYCNKLITSLLESETSLEIEFWSYGFNAKNVCSLFNNVLDVYEDRIFCYYEQGRYYPTANDGICSIVSRKPILEILNSNKIICGLKTLIKPLLPLLVKKIGRLIDTVFPSKNVYTERKNKLISAIKMHSLADAVYVMNPILEGGHYFDCKKIVQLHDLFTFQFASVFAANSPHAKCHNRSIAKNLRKYAEENAHFVSSTSYIVQKHVLKYIKAITREKCHVIPFPPMLSVFDPSKLPSSEEFRKKFGIKGAYLPFASQNRPNKNLIQLLRAVKILRDRGIEITVVTTGKVENVESDREYIKENLLADHIMEIGMLSQCDLFALYAYSSMVVVTTYIEGYGMSGQCLEALLTKSTPVVHVKSHGMEESLASVGLAFETAPLNWVDLGDHEMLAHRIEEVLQNRQKHIERQGKILSHYMNITWRDVAQNYLDLFSQK